MSDIVIRPAEEGDFSAVSALLAELGRPRLTPETTEAAQAVYERHVADRNTQSLVAERHGEVIGFLSLVFRERLNCVRPQAWIPDLIVTETARELGAGKALLERAFGLADSYGCDRVVLESGYSRTVAHKLYEASGMTNGGYYFTRSLA